MSCLTCTEYYSFSVVYACSSLECTEGTVTITSKLLETILVGDTVTLTYSKVSCSNSTDTDISILDGDVVQVGDNFTYSFTDTLSQGLYKYTLTKETATCTFTEDFVLFYDGDLNCRVIDYTLANKGTNILPSTTDRLKPLLLHYALNNAQGCVCDADKMKLLYDELILLLDYTDDCGC
jgi:hypothetical protein